MLAPAVRLFSITVCITILNGCAPPVIVNDPDFRPPLFSELRVDRIAVLPVADLRAEKSLEPDTGGMLDFVVKLLEQRDYEVELSDHLDTAISATDFPVLIHDSSWIKDLSPDNRRWMLLITIDTLYRTVTI